MIPKNQLMATFFSLNKGMSDDQTHKDQEMNVDTLLDQLKTIPMLGKKIEEQTDEVTKDNLEEFVVKYAGRLIKNASESVDYVKDIVQSAPTPDDVLALAELVKSTSSALDILNKIIINDKKIDASIKIKNIDVESRKEELDTKVNAALTITRDEMLKKLLADSKVIDATIVEDDKPII
jgi:hypothetical protein